MGLYSAIYWLNSDFWTVSFQQEPPGTIQFQARGSRICFIQVRGCGKVFLASADEVGDVSVTERVAQNWTTSASQAGVSVRIAQGWSG